LYPNPATDVLEINLGSISNTPIIIYDLKGSVVKSISANNKKVMSIDIQDLSNGTYVIKCGTQHKKFIKQ
jgi:hypothetical protein